MSEPASIDADGYRVSAEIPAGIPACCFAIIDANGYRTYSKTVKVPASSK